MEDHFIEGRWEEVLIYNPELLGLSFVSQPANLVEEVTSICHNKNITHPKYFSQ